MTKIFHPDHGFLYRGDDNEIKELLASGGVIVTKNSDINAPIVDIPEPKAVTPVIRHRRPKSN